MKAVFYESYGGPEVLRFGELPDPTPRRGEVLVEVRAAALNPKDVLVRKGKFKMFTRGRFPRIPGHDLAGVVRGRGGGVTDLAIGDEVFGMVNAWRAGTCAELICVPAKEVALKPPGISMEAAAGLPLAGQTALQGLRDHLKVKPGERVALNGASGGVGLLAIQIARRFGAHVVAICSARNEPLVREYGAQEVIPYDEADAFAPGERYAAIYDLFGNRPYASVEGNLTGAGRYVTTIVGVVAILRALASRLSRKRAGVVVVRSVRRDLEQLGRWVADGSLRPVNDRILPLDESPAAHRYLETRRARGKVVLTVGRSGA